MDRNKFKRKTSAILKILGIAHAVILSIALVIALAYSRFGLMGFAGDLIHEDKQMILEREEISAGELEYIQEEIGFDPLNKSTNTINDRKRITLKISASGFETVIKAYITDPDAFTNLQMSSEDETVKISAIADTDILLGFFESGREQIEGTIGKVPDKVPVYIEFIPGEGDDTSKISLVKIGSLKIPDRITAMIAPYTDEGLELLFRNGMGITLEDIYAEDGNIHISGVFPIQE